MKPSRFSALGLRQRLLLAILLPMTAVFAISVVFDYRLAKATADAAFDQSLADAVLDISSHIQAGSDELSLELSSEAEAMLRTDSSDKIYFAVRDGNGHLLAGDSDLPFPAVRPLDQPQFHDLQFRGGWTRAAVHQVDSASGTITIAVAETLTKRNRASRRILVAMILPSLALIVATLLAVYFGVRSGLAPLDAVEREIASRSPRDLHEFDANAVSRELRPILARLNGLFGMLREASAAQQRFLADAAHQLRTPLAGLQTQLDLASAEGRFADDEDRLARIQEATDRIGHLIDQLLLYARAEPATVATQAFEPVHLDRLAENSATIFLDRALGKGIDLGYEIAPATAWGIPWMLREALANLIDNAICYTPAGGTITVRSLAKGEQARLEVEDDGPGIPLDERQRVFERFYRIPGSPGEGCGLGLSIVREIAEIHGASLEVDSPETGGLCISLCFATKAATP